MSTIRFEVHYRRRKSGKPGWAGTSQVGTLPQKSEALLIQKLQSKHKGSEIEVKRIKWK